MLSTKLPLILLLLFVFTVRFVYPQNYDYKNLTFEHLSIEHGLSQITVHSILEDNNGFLWFGTEDGLNRYDGYEFVVYRNDPTDSNSISDNFIWSLFQDSDNNIWVGTNSGGLNKYCYSTNSFKTYPNNLTSRANNIRVIFEDSFKNLWIGTNNAGLFKFDKRKGTFDNILFSPSENYSIRAMCEDSSKILWVGTNENGLFAYNSITNQIEDFTKSNSNITSNAIWALATDFRNNIWIGTYNGGLNKFDRTKKTFTSFMNTGSDKEIINNNITSLIIDNYNNPWICTEGGLSIYLDHKNEFVNYKHNLSDLRSLSNSFLRVIVKAKSNLIWIGTVGGGLNKLNLNKKFNQFNHNPTNENSLSHNMIRAIEGDSKGNIWIGTLGNGINRYDKQKNRFQRFNSRSMGLSEDVVTSILEDKNNSLWVGTWGGGLNKIKFSFDNDGYKVVKLNIYKHLPNNSQSFSSDIIQDIFEDSNGNLWIGTEDGLDYYHPMKHKFIHFKNDPNNKLSISDNRIQSSCIIEDKFGYLWIGTWQGLNRVKIGDESDFEGNKSFRKFYKENGLSDNRIISIYEDIERSSTDSLILWIGSIGGGLNKLIAKISDGEISDYKIKNYNMSNGLPSNVIYGILGDNEGNLWLSTNNGISKFNANQESFRNYTMEDGLQSNQFFWGAAHSTLDGEFYFGGINGLNSFYPNQFLENKNIPQIFITKCSIESLDGSKKIVLDNVEEIKNNNSIELPYDNYNLKFVFTALDLTTPSRNLYRYILDNYDEKWTENSYLNSVSYTSINDGNYTFQVLGSNNDGYWNLSGTSFNIIIRTPYWKTWWFISIIVMLISGLVFYTIITQIKNLLAVERLRTKLAADLHDNIGSSLTEISILSEVISSRLKTDDNDILHNLEKISTKSRKLIDKMSDIVWLVNPQRDSLYDLILRLQDTYADLLSDTEISFRCENLKSLEKVSLSMEHRQHLFLVFKEAINNAVTHSGCTEIFLKANVNGRILKMILLDNGHGFEFNENEIGNGLNNMKTRSKKIGGKLNIKSSVGKGTVVEYIGSIR